jgi:hypothetical protein
MKNEIIDYSLVDVHGKLIETKKLDVIGGINTLEINIHQLQLSKGIYFIKLATSKTQITKKLIVE